MSKEIKAEHLKLIMNHVRRVLLKDDRNWTRQEIEFAINTIESTFELMENTSLDVVLDRDISTLDLSRRAFKRLVYSANISTIRQLVNYTRADLKKLRGFGDTCDRQVRRKLREIGLCLKGETLVQE